MSARPKTPDVDFLDVGDGENNDNVLHVFSAAQQAEAEAATRAKRAARGSRPTTPPAGAAASARFRVLSAHEFVTGEHNPASDPPDTPEPSDADLEAIASDARATGEWITYFLAQRPLTIGDEAWDDFADACMHFFDLDGPTIEVRERTTGRLIARGRRDGKPCGLVWPERHVILEGDADGARPEAGDVRAATDWLALADKPRASRHIADVLAKPTVVRWLKRDELERGVIAVMSGPRGKYKSALSVEWIGHVVVTLREPVLWLTAEGTGTQRRFAAWLKVNAPDVDAKALPLRVIERRHDLNSGEGLKLVSDELAAMTLEFGGSPALCVIDTYSKYSGGLDENSNSEVKLFIGGLDAAIRRKYDCSVLLIAHTGLSDRSRARGASALEADTDAAYIVAFDHGLVTMSRERFKDSPELPPLAFTPEVVDLGYRDADGVPVTGIVLRSATGKGAMHRAARPVPIRGVNQRHAFTAVQELSPGGEEVEIAVVIDLALSRKGRDGGAPVRERDERRNLRNALDAVALTGRIHINGDRVALAGPVQCGDFDP